MSKNQYPYQRLYERDQFTCQLCGWDGRASFDHWWVGSLSVTHIKPPQHGGTEEDDNLILACHACIQHKGDADCDTLEEARKVSTANRAHARAWFTQHVEPGG